MRRYFRYILVVVFLIAITVIVFLQFISNTNIDQLISGNEDLLESQNIKAELQRLQKNIFALDAETKAIVISGERKTAPAPGLLNKTGQVWKAQNSLHVLESEPELAVPVAQLKRLVAQKLLFNQQLLDTFNLKGKREAEAMINNMEGAKLSDSISVLANKIDELHQQDAIKIINEADENGRQAKVFGSLLAILAIAASMLTFGYVSFKMMEQRKLITKLNLSEQLARESALVKERFLANMSHEIRTPLNAILGFAGLLKKKEMDDEAEKYINFINVAGDNLLNIVNDVLDLSKIEAGMLHISSTPFDFKELIENITNVYKEKALEKNLQLITIVSPSIPKYVLGDAARVSQVLTNLIGNALKFTHNGEIAINCETIKKTDNNSILSIIVSDTGIGIGQDQLNYIFERFRQSDETVSRRYGGTGLGLTIVQDLVKLMNGTIDVSSTEGVGTNFNLSIPFGITGYDPPGNILKRIHDNAVFESADPVLVAEDNEINRSLMEHLLSSWKIKFDIVNDGNAAIEKVKNNNYALILMDIQMPGKDGYAATNDMRKNLKVTMPIIAMTAHAMPGEKEKCVQHGMNDYISKPIDAGALKSLLANYLPVKKDEGFNQVTTEREEHVFKYIDTAYLKSISLGNKEYEKAVTEQFIEIVPQELSAMKNALAEKRIGAVKEIAHSLKTSVSIMGILPLVQENLDELEHTEPDETIFEKHFELLSFICQASVEEARSFLKSI